jgi:hypothetical protein
MALDCGHHFCNECLSNYWVSLVKKISGFCAMKCPTKNCREVMHTDFVEKLDQGIIDKWRDQYFKNLSTEIVTSCGLYIPCSVRNCQLYLKVDEDDYWAMKVNEDDFWAIQENRLEPRDTQCECGGMMCLGCGQPGHEPV